MTTTTTTMEEPKKQCWECRRRRLVCDFARPQCRKCQVRGVDCPGYDSKPLRWLQPQQVNAKGPQKMVVPRTIKLNGDREMTAVLEAIGYFNLHIAPDMVATGVGGCENPYWMPPFTARLLPRSFTQSMVCTSLCHRILQSREALPSDQVVLARRLQKHRSDALQALTADLAQQADQISDLTLASVLILLLVELQQSFEPPNWRHHANGAAVMINLKGGLGNLVFTRPYFRHLFRYYALIEIIGNTTSPRVEADSARNQLDMITLLPVLYGNGLASCFPCPPDLLIEVIRINHLRSIFQKVSALNARSTPTEDKHTAALDILRRIRSYSVDKWAAEVAVSLSGCDSIADPSAWLAIACIFQSAVAIYCIASLFQDALEFTEGFLLNSTTDTHLAPRNVLTQLRAEYASGLFSRFQEVSKYTQLRKQVIWPLFVAGVEADDEVTRKYIVGELRWISNALGTAVPLVAKDLLENRVWQLGLGRGSWDGLFDQSYVFVL